MIETIVRAYLNSQESFTAWDPAPYYTGTLNVSIWAYGFVQLFFRHAQVEISSKNVHTTVDLHKPDSIESLPGLIKFIIDANNEWQTKRDRVGAA